MSSIKQEIEKAIDGLQFFIDDSQPDRDELFHYLKSTPLLFIACYHKDLSAGECFDLSFRFLHVLGQYNLALAVGVCMNQYIAYSIAYLPTEAGSILDTLKNDFMKIIRDERWVLAVSSFDDFVRNKNDKRNLVSCELQKDGSYICNGVKNFQSNVSFADVLLFSAEVGDGDTALFYTFLKNVEGLQLGDEIYSGAMADADTRSLTFNNLKLADFQAVPTDDNTEALSLHTFTRVIFAIMSMAPYMGGAKRALNETAEFLRNMHIDGRALAELDGYKLDMGRLLVRYHVCNDLVDRFTLSLNDVTAENVVAWIEGENPRVMSAKNHISSECEELVTFARRTIGTRSLSNSHIVHRLSQQIQFGPLHPVINAKIERDLGETFLMGKDF